MSVSMSISINERKLQVKLKKKRARITPKFMTGLQKALYKLRGQEVKDLTSNRFGLKTSSGKLRNSLAVAVRKSGDQVVGLMGTNVKYARIHEDGGTIRPKSSKFLTIPFPGITGRAREYQNTFFHRFSAGHLILFQTTGPGTIRPLFTLVKSVKVKKKKWMSKSFKATKKDLLKIMRKSMLEAITA